MAALLGIVVKKNDYCLHFPSLTGILKKVTTYSSSDESGEEDLNEAPPSPEPQPSSVPSVKTENGHTEVHPNGKCDHEYQRIFT